MTQTCLFDRVFGRAKIGDSCWETTTGPGSHGYGQAVVGGQVTTAPRAAYIAWHNRLPEGQVNHTCDNKLCIRPSHLYDGTHADNMDDLARSMSHGGRRLTTEQARAIKRSPLSQRVLAAQYGVDQRTIWQIRNGKTYRYD